MDSARRAWEAKKRADALPPAPELERRLEELTDLEHAYYSSKVGGSRLTWAEFLVAIEGEEDGTS